MDRCRGRWGNYGQRVNPDTHFFSKTKKDCVLAVSSVWRLTITSNVTIRPDKFYWNQKSFLTVNPKGAVFLQDFAFPKLCPEANSPFAMKKYMHTRTYQRSYVVITQQALFVCFSFFANFEKMIQGSRWVIPDSSPVLPHNCLGKHRWRFLS